MAEEIKEEVIEETVEEEVVVEEAVEEVVVEETVEEEVAEPEVTKSSSKGKWIRRGVAGVMVVVAIVTMVVVLVTKKPLPEEPKTPEVNIGDVSNDQFKEETGIQQSSMVVKEGETLPWFVVTGKDEAGNSVYSVVLTGDYDQFINVEANPGNESQTVRSAVALTVSKEAVEAGEEAINQAILEAKKEDYRKVCSYGVNENYEDAIVGYCSSLEEYANVDFDWETAKMVDLNSSNSLTGSAYVMEKDGLKSIAALYNFIDAEGKVLNVALGADAYENAKEKKEQTNLINGTLEEEYTAEMFSEFTPLDETATKELAASSIMNTDNIVLSGSYKEPVKEVAPEVEQETTQPLSAKQNHGIRDYLNSNRKYNKNTGSRYYC